MSESLQQPPIKLTDAAARKIWELIQEENNYKLKLRVYVTGGGCSGMRYAFTFDEVVQPDDTVVSKRIAGARVPAGSDIQPIVALLVDPLSLQYLQGAEIDYQEESVGDDGHIEEEQFIIRNPNAKTTCGCGSSFTTEEETIIPASQE